MRCSSSTRPAAPGSRTRRGRRSPPQHTWEGARRTAANLLGVADHGAGSGETETFWKPAGARYLAPLLLAAAHGGHTMAVILRWLAGAEEEEPAELLKSCPEPQRRAGA